MDELPDVGACVVLVPEFADWPALLGLLAAGDWVCAELVDEGLLVCADPWDVGADEDGVVLEEDGVVVDLESCWRWFTGGLEFDVLGDDCANADVAIATKAVVANNKRLLI